VLDPLPEGFYWKNPFTWDWRIVEQVEIPAGKLGVVVRQYGDPLDPGQIIARDGQKGLLATPLRPGRHLINSLVHKVVVSDAVEVPPGHVGVVTFLAGREPEDPNRFVVGEGEKGVQMTTLPPGTFYPNPYQQRIDSVDLRAHRFDMEDVDAIRFPSSDGFPITMVGTIEWYIDKQRVPEVFVKYVDKRDVITCIVEKIILPYARAFSRIEGSRHLARDFIGGVTRQKFQKAFLVGVQQACGREGIVIKSALVRDTLPPDEIATPIRQLEIAIREKEKYQQEKKREIQEKELAMEAKLMARMTKVKDAEAQVAVSITKAREKQRVAVIEADRKLEVAGLELKAAEDQANALKEKGQAEAAVVVFNNKAKAAGIRASREAFQDGSIYVKYLYYQKIAPALAYILSNTEGPFADIFKEFGTSKGGAKKK
jgi:regulator of protease activity HflC (stomatin/prohibitin superfamily)